MSLSNALTTYSIRRPRAVLFATLALALLATIGFVRIQVDTDPENMLPSDDPVRLRNAELSEAVGAGPMIVVGVFGDVASVEGFNAIDRVHDALAERHDVVASSTVSIGSLFDGPLTTYADVERIAAAAGSDQLLGGNVLFDDQPGAAIFVGLVEKGVATEVAEAARDLAEAEPALAAHDVAVAGQPLAEDAFGQQMFIQMAVFAPMAGLLVFVVMLLFFRRLFLVIPAMLLSMATVVITMGALVGSGNTLHIMSSMIPIFLMPIALLDSVHVLSEFFDRYDGRDRAGTMQSVLDELRRPIGYTTLTTAVGFGALALVPIPPVRLFGSFVALGVGLAWLLTFTFLPAFMVSVEEHRLIGSDSAARRGIRRPMAVGRLVVQRHWFVLAAFVAIGLAALPALPSSTVNDNPVRWFRSSHEVRTATDRLGDALPGTFTASLVATGLDERSLDDGATRAGVERLVAALESDPEVGAVQAYTRGDHPLLRSGEVANIRLQLRTGDNTAMQAVVDRADAHLATDPVPGLASLEWAGEAYLNLTWQQKMVSGMLTGFATTIVVIFVLLTALFRSPRWAALAMAPVLWTVLVVYGALAFLGRDFDMPVAVLSTLVLGIGVDFAIHFVERYRSLRASTGSSGAAVEAFYREPARAMTRNAVTIAVGFSPLLLSSLVPYVVVGVLLASIVTLSWLASIVVLPAAVVTAPAGSAGQLIRSREMLVHEV